MNSSSREFTIRTKLSHGVLSDYEKILLLIIFDDTNHASEQIILEQHESSDSNHIETFSVQIKENLAENIEKLKIHSRNRDKSQTNSEKHRRIFMKWIEITDIQTKQIFCFPVDDYLPSSVGDALELTEVHRDQSCQNSKQTVTTNNLQSNYGKSYDVRTKIGRQGFLGLGSTVNAFVYLKLNDIHDQTSDVLPLIKSTLHKKPFRSNQTDQFEINTKTNLDLLKTVEVFHDGGTKTKLHFETLEITDQNNGQIYCFQIKDYLRGETTLILDKYIDQRCLKTNSNSRKTSDMDSNSENESNSKILPSAIPTSSQLSTESTNQSLFKIRTRVGHKGFLSLGMGGTDAKLYVRLHEGDNSSNDILLNNSLTHKNPFEAGHTDVFEIGASEQIISPDKLEVYHNGSKHDGVYLKWIEIMNLKTFERKCFPVHRWLDSNEGDKKTHLLLTKFIRDESCEEAEYRDHHTHDQYKTEYVIRTKTHREQPENPSDARANIYLKIFDDKKKHTEDMLLSHSKHHSNPFQAGKIDKFDVGSSQLLDDSIDKIELWHDNKSDFNWFCDWIEIKNKKTGNVKCFGVNRLLSPKSSDRSSKIVLSLQSNRPCDKVEQELQNLSHKIHTDRIARQPNVAIKPDFKKKYIITTKTGNKMLAGTDANVYLRLYDDQNQQSEDLLLEQSLTNKHKFEKHQIDEFHTGTSKNLSDLKAVRLWHTGGKNHGWHVKWLQIEDLDAQHLYCFPVNKWLDLNSDDKTTDVTLTEFMIDQSCSTVTNQKDQTKLQKSSRINEQEQETSLKRTYYVETKTGKRGLLGLSPTGTNAKVFMKIHDENGEISEPIALHKSTRHRNKFERGQTDGFDVGSSQSLTGIDKLELWHDDSGVGKGWFLDYISVKDNQTNEEACFFVGQYLNDKYGGVTDRHLILDKQPTDTRPCREHFLDVNESKMTESTAQKDQPMPYKQNYLIEVKTGHTGLFGLGGAGTDAPVYVRIHDNLDNVSESIRLKKSLRHTNKFERNQTDQFDVGTYKDLDGVQKLDLWHEGGKNDGWQVDFVNVTDKKTGDSYCFLANAMLDKNSGLKQTNILLENPSINVRCLDEFKQMKLTSNVKSTYPTASEKDDKIQRHFTIRTKTGNQIEAGSTTPIHIQLYDDKQQESEDIRLKHKEHDRHNFEPGAIDQFEVTSAQSLSDQLVGIRVKHHAPKYQGWYAEWIEIVDEDNQRTYCYPIQRWIDKGENDKQANIYFEETSEVLCDSLPDTMPQTDRQTHLLNSKSVPTEESSHSQISTSLKTTYHVKAKTGKKGFLGLSPTGTNAKVFMRVIDKNGQTSEPMQLAKSTEHKNKFERGQTDEFDVGSREELDGIDEIELWTDGKGVGSGWFPKYLEVTDNKTNEVACFPVNQYLNKKYGGTEESPLKLKRLPAEDRPCQELVKELEGQDSENEDTSINTKQSEAAHVFQNTYSVVTKTGRTGFLGLGPSGTNAPVYIRIHDTQGQISKPIRLKHSTRHKNKFERNQTDQFDIGTDEPLVGIARLELWHEGNKNDGWQVDYVQIHDNQTNTSYCFPVNSMLDKNSGLKDTHVLLEKFVTDVPCPQQIEALKAKRTNSDVTNSKNKKEKHQRNFTIRTKTGDQIEAGSTAPIHIQLFDDHNQSSEDIRLLRKDNHIHNFVPGAIDTFQVTSEQPLSSQISGIRVKHHADKYQGWYCDWIEIYDEDNDKVYCYPVQRWIDKGENDKRTDVYFTETSSIPCESLSNPNPEAHRRSIPATRQINKVKSAKSSEEQSNLIPFKNTYHVETKTGKKGFLGLSPTGTNAAVFMRIIDQDGNKSEAIHLKESTVHKSKFERNQTDEFEIGSTKSLNGINQLEIWTDGKGLGHGWFADHVLVRDNKTDEEACFLIGQYLNKEYGGVTDNHLILDKQMDDVPCRKKLRKLEDDLDTIQTRQMSAVKMSRESQEELASAVPFRRTYHVDTKTGEKGFLGLSPTGTNADVYLRIHDKSGQVSEPIRLRRSTKHSNPFEKGHTDSFDIGSKVSLQSINEIEVYHNGSGLGQGWNVEYINITDNTKEHSYCFPANQWINKGEHLMLDQYYFDEPCPQMKKEQHQSKSVAPISHTESNSSQQKRSFTVRTKTGAHIEAGSTAPIYLRLFDNQSEKSEKIRLKNKDKDGHHFQPGAIDEFEITSDQPLNTIDSIQLSHKADKYQGWYGEWVSVTDHDRNETYCFPLQRWLDKGELDGKTEIVLKRQTNVSCDDLPDTMQRSSLRSNIRLQSSKPTDSTNNDYKSNYHIEVETAKKGALGLAPTGTDANVFIRLHDNKGNISEPIQLKKSLSHKDKFVRGQIDWFDVGSTQELSNIEDLEIWTDGKGLGSGWYPNFVQVRDEKTRETTCFGIGQYLNEKYGGSEDKHLIVHKQEHNGLCQENDRLGSVYRQQQPHRDSFDTSRPERFQVKVKTGHTGFLGLGGAGTDAPVFVQMFDSENKQSEIFQLEHSKTHSNKFERNQTDLFLLNTKKSLADVSKVDLWHEGNKNDGWQVDYVQIYDKKTDKSYCFPVNTMLDKNSGLKQTAIRLEKPSINAFCKQQAEALKHSHSETTISKRHKSDKSTRNYTVRTKTGDHPSAGSTTPIYIRLIDVNDKKSKHIQLKKKDADGHHFAPGSTDEFQVVSHEPLSTIKAVKLSVDADKYQGWYGEWISIIDEDNQITSCFPIQRWLDKGEDDRKTHITLHQQSDIPCEQIKSILNNSPISKQAQTYRSPSDFQWEISIQTADKSLKGKSGRDGNVYLNVYDKNNQQIHNSIRLDNSINHETPFQRHHTDRFHLSLPDLNLSDVDRIELYHDGQNDGWFSDFVQIKNVQTNDKKCFSVHQWVDEITGRTQFSVTNYQQIPCDQ